MGQFQPVQERGRVVAVGVGVVGVVGVVSVVVAATIVVWWSLARDNDVAHTMHRQQTNTLDHRTTTTTTTTTTATAMAKITRLERSLHVQRAHQWTMRGFPYFDAFAVGGIHHKIFMARGRRHPTCNRERPRKPRKTENQGVRWCEVPTSPAQTSYPTCASRYPFNMRNTVPSFMSISSTRPKLSTHADTHNRAW